MSEWEGATIPAKCHDCGRIYFVTLPEHATHHSVCRDCWEAFTGMIILDHPSNAIEQGGEPVNDPINHPPHYNSHPSGVECIQITEHYNFCIGNAIKYLWRAGLKADAIEDLKKARWYLDREISNREKPNDDQA